MSDNTEAREALADAILERWENPDTIEASMRGLALLAADAALAALPPVAGPEVRPDETLRARVEALCDEADHVATGSTGKPVGAIVRVRDLRAALAAPTPTDQEAGR